MYWNVCNYTNDHAQTFVSFDTFIGNLHNSGQVDNTHIIVATGRLQRELFKQIVRTEHVRRGGVSEVAIDTLDSFVKKALRVSGLKLRLGTLEQLDYLVMRAIRQSDLQYFAYEGSVSASAVARLVTIVRGLRKDGITAAHMHADVLADEGIVDPKRFADIATIMEQFEQLLKQSDVYDYAALISTLVSVTTDSIADLTDKQRIVFVGFHEFTEPEVSFLQWLGAAPQEVSLFCEGSLQNASAFRHIRDITQRLSKNGWYAHTQTVSEPSVCAQLANTLFASEEGRVIDVENMIQIRAFASPRAEVQYITQTCLELIESGVDPAEICVLTRSPELYSPLLRSSFTEAEIPFNSSDRFVLSEASIYADLRSLLMMVNSGFRSETVLLFAISDLAKKLSPQLYMHVALIREEVGRIRFAGGHKHGGLSAWHKVLRALGEDVQSSVMSELEQLSNAFSTSSQAVTTWIRKLQSLLQESGVLASLVVDYYKQVRNSNIRLAGSLVDAELLSSSFNCLLRLFSSVATFEHLSAGEERLSLREFMDLLDMTARRMRYTVREIGDDGVLVTTTEQVRGIGYRVVMICGLYEGAFPRSYQPEVFLGKELPETSEKFYDREKTDFILAVTNDSVAFEQRRKQVFLTYPTFVQSVETMESSFVRELVAKANVSVEHVTALSPFLEDSRQVPNLQTGLKNSQSAFVERRVESLLEKGLSPSFLEEYAHCGYKTLLRRFAKLDDSTDYGLELESRERGSIVHNLLEALVDSIRESKQCVLRSNSYLGHAPFGLLQEHETTYTSTLKNLTMEYFRQNSNNSEVSDLHERSIGDGVVPGVLTRIYEQLLEQLVGTDWLVLATELNLVEANGGSPVQVFDEYSVQGHIDRVDIRFNDDSIELRVVDYKTGGLSDLSSKSYVEGRRFQMSLYAAALEQLFLEHEGVNANVVSAIYVSGSRSLAVKNRTKDVFTDRKGETLRQEILAATSEHLRAYVDDLRAGVFALASNIKYCPTCDFQTVCRVFDRSTTPV